MRRAQFDAAVADLESHVDGQAYTVSVLLRGGHEVQGPLYRPGEFDLVKIDQELESGKTIPMVLAIDDIVALGLLEIT